MKLLTEYKRKVKKNSKLRSKIKQLKDELHKTDKERLFKIYTNNETLSLDMNLYNSALKGIETDDRFVLFKYNNILDEVNDYYLQTITEMEN